MEVLTIDQFYDSARNGKLLGLECEAGHVTVPPRRTCNICQSTRMRVKELKGRGRVVSFTKVHVKAKDFPVPTPYILALVTFGEGGNLLGVLDSQVAQQDFEVIVRFRDFGEKDRWPRVFFEPTK